jgi:hypothetical protein
MQALSEKGAAMTDEAKEPTGRAKGGIARAAKMTPGERSAQARKAAMVRHGLKATHKGNFKEEFGFDVECYVLNDEAKTAVVTLRGLGVALGFAPGSSERVPSFLAGAKIAPYVGRELREKLQKPLVFQGPTVVAEVPGFAGGHGYDVTLLIDVCKIIVQAEADGALLKRHEAIAKQAHVILGASAKAGIKGLVYALSGYRPEVEEVIQAFKVFVQQEVREYEREFPPKLYAHWYRLYDLTKPERGRPWKAKFLTIDHVYHPLARSSGKVLELMRALKAQGEDRSAKLHQFLSETGVKALRAQVNQLLGIASISRTAAEYEAHVRTAFGDQPELPGMEP